MRTRRQPQTNEVRQTQDDRSVVTQLAELPRLSVNELKQKWQALLGTPAPNNARAFLELRISWRIQELSYGGLNRDTRRTLELLADEIEGKITRKSMVKDPRNPIPGTRLIREWDGVQHTVTVLREGYEWEGRTYRSLSAIARIITGINWNGFRFFALNGLRRKR